MLAGNPVEVTLSHSTPSVPSPAPGLTLPLLVAQVCPLTGEILRQLDVKLLKGLVVDCLVHPRRIAQNWQVVEEGTWPRAREAC